MKLLHIDSSGRRNSASRQLTSEFVVHWKREYPDGEVTQRDLAAEAFSPAPMHNFTISWPLKAWIDQIVRVGKTAAYGKKGPRGVLEGKRVVVINSRGGSRRPATQSSHVDFLEPYLRAVLGFVGLTDVAFIHAENQYRLDQALAGRAAALQQIEQTIAELAVVVPPTSASEYAIDMR